MKYFFSSGIGRYLKAILIFLFLLSLDLISKYIFRFHEQSIDLPITFVEGYLYIETVIFNYGTVFSESQGAEDPQVLGNALFYIFASVGVLGAAVTLFSRKEDESFLYSVSPLVVISGILGNTIDKLFYEGVCDWLTVTRPDSSVYYVINLADIYLIFGLYAFGFIVAKSAKIRSIWVLLLSYYNLWFFQGIIFDFE